MTIHAQCKVYLMDAFHGLESLSPMWVQTNKFVSKLTEVMEQHPEGVNVLDYLRKEAASDKAYSRMKFAER
ncbi:unnamed protein product [Darwinula stevensoni]|uniref:Uncharacterized protein n=1 Tax=Darwinula stevensoni TaxID=69355 RepID=A0A7R9FR44_9CRUS|nr:unnamed protein product [Darwinula stevensoni]CAG0900726.1 unnamed protein product [Darwinula stevensoni]